MKVKYLSISQQQLLLMYWVLLPQQPLGLKAIEEMQKKNIDKEKHQDQ